MLLIGLIVPFQTLPPATASETTIAQVQPQVRRRIAVLDFDFASTGLTASGFSLFGGIGPAQGVSELLTNRLVQNGSFTVIERSRVAAVLREQNLGMSGRVDASTAASVGRILGADAVVIGSITRFNLEERRSGTRILGIGSTNRRHTADVQLTARLVDTSTSEVIAVAEGKGTADQGGGGFSLGGLFGTDSGTSNIDTLLSRASETAVSELAGQLATNAQRISASSPSSRASEAVVADVSGGQLILNRGSQAGFTVGMTVSIERVSRQVTDPTTGRVLRTLTTPVGRIQLTEVDGQSSVGRVISGTGFRVGDRATPTP